MNLDMSELPDGITRCSRYLGYHAFQAGPCFDTESDATRYRDRLQHFGLTWKPQDQSWWEASIQTGIPMFDPEET